MEDKKIDDAEIDELLRDWFERDGDTFIKVHKKRAFWESTLKKGSAYSSYLLEAPTHEDLIKRAYTLAKETLVAMNPPFKIGVKVTPGMGADGIPGFSTGKYVCVKTAMLDDEDLSVGERLDVFLGVTIHEGCHILYTNFNDIKELKDITRQVFNILEDERIEGICADCKPGLANFLAKSKYYYFDRHYLKKPITTPFGRVMDCLLHIIRYPKYLKKEEIIEFKHYLKKIKKVLVPYPQTTKDTVMAAEKIADIIKEFYREEKKGSEEELMLDSYEAHDVLDKISGNPESMPLHFGGNGGVYSDEVSSTLLKGGALDKKMCEGMEELGDCEGTFFALPDGDNPVYKDTYKNSLMEIKRYIPAVSKVLKGHCREYKLTHRSMRSGVLDTNKLAEAFQGVPTVYAREGEVKTDKIALCLLIDESGSMNARGKIKSARDAAILINEAASNIPNVELFIYGHSADIRNNGTTNLFIYREKDYAPRFSLGSVHARCENRDGVAIIEVAKRVRKQTKNPAMLFVISDGEPTADKYRGNAAINHTRDCVDKASALGFNVIQVCIQNSYDPGLMFKHYIILDDMSTFAIELGKVIKKAVVNTTKVSTI